MRERTGNSGRRKYQRLLPFEVNSSIPKLPLGIPASPDPHDRDGVVLCLLSQTLY